MEENKEAIVQNKEAEAAAGSAADDGIVYTFVVPKGEVYKEPGDAEGYGGGETGPVTGQTAEEPETEEVSEHAEEPETEEVSEAAEEPDPAATIVADRRGIDDALAPAPVYADTGLPDDDITYTFVVPRGEIYREPDPEEERAAKEAEKARIAAAGILSAETKVMERSPGTGAANYGLPADHPGMGELARKQEARRLYKQKKRNRFRTRFYVLMTSVILLILWLIISNSGVFTIDAIEVKGNSHYTAEEIINIAHAGSGRNIIYKANIKETKEFLERNPYIKSAEVRRRLPSTLVIKVTEREERLAFKYDDDYLVMDEDGILLRKTRNKPKITVVQGVIVSKIKLGEKIGADNEEIMDKALDLIKTMISSDLYFVKADISDEKKTEAFIYDTLVVKTDYDTLMTNMENGRLHLVVEKLFDDGIERGTITFGEDGSASFMPTF